MSALMQLSTSDVLCARVKRRDAQFPPFRRESRGNLVVLLYYDCYRNVKEHIRVAGVVCYIETISA